MMPSYIERTIQDFIRGLQNPDKPLDYSLAEFISQLAQDNSDLSPKRQQLIEGLIYRLIKTLETLNRGLAVKVSSQVQELLEKPQRSAHPIKKKIDTSQQVATSEPINLSQRAQKEEQLLIDAWNEYSRGGDGHFNASGLLHFISAKGLRGNVYTNTPKEFEDHVIGVDPGSGEDITVTSPRSEDNLLGVDLNYPDGHIYLIPNFNRPPRAVKEYFDFSGKVSKLARIERIIQLAIVKKLHREWVIIRRGIVS